MAELWVLPRLVIAHVVLGEDEAARGLASDLEALATSTEISPLWLKWNAVSAWQWIDSDHAVELYLEMLKFKKLSGGYDPSISLGHSAVSPYFYTPLLKHPTVQSLYVQDGRWIDYLAERFPEYAVHKNAGK